MAELDRSNPAPLDISVEQGSSGPTVVVRGELDIGNADELEGVLDDVVGRRPDAALRLELSGLKFMDSSGIALLLRTAGRVRELSLVKPSAAVRRLLEITGLTDVLRVEQARDQ